MPTSCSSARPCGSPSRPMSTASTGLSGGRCRADDRLGNVFLPDAEGRDEDRHDRVDGRVVQQCAHRGAIAVRRRRRDHVERIADGCLVGKERSSRSTVAWLEFGEIETTGLHRVGGEDARPAGVREHRRAPRARKRAHLERHGQVEQLLDRTTRAARRPARASRPPRRHSPRARRYATMRRARRHASAPISRR